MTKKKFDVFETLTKMIEEAQEADNQKLAKELGFLQLEVVKERTREWESGYDCGYGLAFREIELRRLKKQPSQVLIRK